MAEAIPIRKTEPSETKLVDANQKSIDALPLNSGMWRVQGIPGLYVRARATTKSFVQQKRIGGVLVKEVLGPLPMKLAKQKAMSRWNDLKPGAAEGIPRLGDAIESYIKHRLAMHKMAPKTERLARYNTAQYLDAWKQRTLEQIGNDRPGLMRLHGQLTERHGPATCNQVMRLLSAVYRWHQGTVCEELPDWPRKSAEIHSIAPRDWAYSEEELKTWWFSTVKTKAGKIVEKGVSTLGPIKKMWWLTALFTGARKGSLEALKWTDIELEKKTIHFRVTKGDRPYIVPMSDKLAELLKKYRDSGEVPPSEWVFPSRVIDGAHLGDVKDDKAGVGPAHRLRHSFRTTLAQLGAGPDQARMLMGHSMGGDVSRGYITPALVTASLRPLVDAVAGHYAQVIGFKIVELD